ncbi:DUF3046 domain-containing protein [Schaalia sp. lx-100]|uniref:DUF3046 domain-containing protein n=1 Tax=Schaalia sp. lx-100 TaxID=2899081 RepID=UPI001E4E2481|nr:DUF3046 domain-containing protein [Schaalia sp. lx-100]MCD4556691.1 DUF3046 domain-containing protein [Schaalia sp. lx-100]
MRLFEFWKAVDDVYGVTYGRSLVADLYLTSLKGTAQEAIDRGDDPDSVWAALISETEQDERARWVHRIDPKERKKRA